MIQLIPVETIPDIEPGAPLGRLILEAIARSGYAIEPGDLLVIAQKIVSKAEGRIVRLDSNLLEIVLGETKRIVRHERGILIAETHHGFICANAGVDLSNVDGGASVTLLPVDPDASAARLSGELGVPVIISDTFGRPWREGLLDVAIGVHGLAPATDYRAQLDPYGYTLKATVLADADQLAAAAGLVFRKTARVPVCLIRGFPYTPAAGSARELIRAPRNDLFR